MIQQNGDVLRILNDFRNKMRDLDILISESKIKNIYNLYTKSDLSIDEFRKKIYDRFKKYKEKYKIAQSVEENPDNKDLLDIDFNKKGITLNHQDIDILSIIACESYDELIELSQKISILDIDEGYLKTYISLDEAKRFVYQCYIDSLVGKNEFFVNKNLKTKAKINLLLKKGILDENEAKELVSIISTGTNIDEMVSRVYQMFGEKAEDIFKIFNSRIVSKSGVKESTWNLYNCMYERIKEFDTFTLDDIIKYNAVTLLNGKTDYENFTRALELAKKFNKKVRLNTLFFYMDFPERYKNKSKEEIKEYLRKYVINLCSYIKENGYEDQIESIDALNELINRFASKVGNEFDLRGTYKDNSDNFAGGWLNYLSLEDVLDVLADAKKILPNTKFIYNEVYLFNDKKYEVFSKILDKIKEYEKTHDIKIIDGIGEQLHIDSSTDIPKIDAFLQKLRENHMKIDITEFDLFVMPSEKYLVPIQLEELRQAKINELYEVLSKYPDVIDGFTIWSKTDDMDHNLSRVNENKIKFKEKLIPNLHGGYFDMEFNTKRDSLMSNLSVINGPAIQKFNYHTHTKRCGHGSNALDEDYVIEAIKKRMKSFGFTEHCPSPKIEYDEINERLSNGDLDEYISSIRKLNINYPEIDVLVGLEAEYAESIRLHLTDLRKKVDYMILGQHEVIFDGEVVNPNNNPEYPLLYARSVINALNSGIFDIVAHPDYFLIYRDTCEDINTYNKFMNNAIAAANMIGRKCEELKIPLEINLDSITRVEQDNYKDGEHSFTHPIFFNELTKYNVKFIYGCDAHRPKAIKNINENILRAETILKTSDMSFVDENYNPVKDRNPELDQMLLLTEMNSYSYETYMLIKLIERLIGDYLPVDLDLKIMDGIEGVILKHQNESKKESQKRFEELINVSEDHFISDEERDRKISNNLKYMESFGNVTTNRINLLQKLKQLVVDASVLGCYTIEDYLIVLKELIEKEVNKNEDIIKRSEQNIDNYLKNKHQRKY